MNRQKNTSAKAKKRYFQYLTKNLILSSKRGIKGSKEV